MSCVLATIAIEDAVVDPLGAKEAVVMAVEHLGSNVRVLWVNVQEPEQMALGGVASEQRTVPAASPRRPAPVPSGGQARAANPRPESRRPRPGKGNMICCKNCEFFRYEPGLDEAGKFRWGICGRTGSAVRELREECGSWTQKQ